MALRSKGRNHNIIYQVCTSVKLLRIYWYYLCKSTSRERERGVGLLCRRSLTAGAYCTTVPYLIHHNPGDTMDHDDQNDNRRQQCRLYLPSNRLGTFRNFFHMDRHIFDIFYRFAKLLEERKTVTVCNQEPQKIIGSCWFVANSSKLSSRSCLFI